jgi:hypothetical protein
MEQKFIIIDNRNEDRVQQLLEEGWRIVSVTSQHVSTESTSWLYGGFAILLERAKQTL